MSAELKPRRIADDVFEIQVAGADDAQALARALRTRIEAEEVVAGLGTVAVRFDPADAARIQRALADNTHGVPSLETGQSVIEIDIAYGGEYGPDLDLVCEQLGLSQDGFIQEHCAIEHKVDMIGFTPGFSYISGLPTRWAIPRLSNPRNRVAAGSVGISAGYTGIYALAGPGGWPLVGRTTAPLFDAEAAEPFLLSPGQSVMFRPA